MAEAEGSSSSQQTVTSVDTIYSKVRVLAVFSRLVGALPLQNTLERDGRKLQFKWTDKFHIWDILICAIIMYLFIINYSSSVLKLVDSENGSVKNVWLILTGYIITVRGLIQFILVHMYAHRFPKLIKELEEYHQILGASINQVSKIRKFINILTMLWAVLILIVLEIVSLSFFSPIVNESIFETLPVATSFMLSNLWKELPMHLFSLICIYLTARIHEIKDEVRKIREKVACEDVGKQLQTLRLQHAALARIVSLLQRCYGSQLAFNLLFVFLDIVLQLFVFLSKTAGKNIFMLFLSLYYFVSSVVLFSIVDRLERTGEMMVDEIAAFDIDPKCSDVQNQVQLFMIQLAARPVKMSASGFYIINNALVVSVIASVATYLVVFIQFANSIATDDG